MKKKIFVFVFLLFVISVIENINMIEAKTKKIDKEVVMQNEKINEKEKEVLLGIKERINAILYPKEEREEDKGGEKKEREIVAYAYDDIMGHAEATIDQCVSFLLANNSHPSIAVSAEELVRYYYLEAEKEGIRPDVAFAQALKETGFFRYGGTVVPEQNNYCGLGTTSEFIQGGYFSSPQIGVRAHIQHLLAYASQKMPVEEIVDPRYWLVRSIYKDRILTKWTDLNGRWAVPGDYYGESILEIFSQILKQPKQEKK